jgi:hypothetical protein
MQILLEDAHTAIEAQCVEPLRDHYSAGLRVLGQQFGDSRFERLQLTGPSSWRRPCGRHLQILSQRAAPDVYRAYLSPAISRRGEEGFSSARYVLVIVLSLPPRRSERNASVRLRLLMLSSPFDRELDLRG